MTLDDRSAQLTVYNVSRDMSGRRVTCLVTGYDVRDHVVSPEVNISVAGKLMTITMTKVIWQKAESLLVCIRRVAATIPNYIFWLGV